MLNVFQSWYLNAGADNARFLSAYRAEKNDKKRALSTPAVNPYSARIDVSRQILTSVDVRFVNLDSKKTAIIKQIKKRP